MASLDARASRGADARNGEGQARAVAPLYKRLPPGPHRLEREQVLRHQRLRIQGAMVEAVAADGYEATSVKQLIALAGVSRRSFYEQFANKQECFLATFDVLARRLVSNLAAHCDPDCTELQERLGPPLDALAMFAAEDPKAATLLLAVPPRLGRPGLSRLCQASAACERLLGAAFGSCAGAGALPAPVLRAIAGGAQAAVASYLAQPGRERDHARLATTLLAWVAMFATPSAPRPVKRAPARPHTRRRRAATAARGREPGAIARELRARLLGGALRLVASEGYCELTGPRIADEARLPVDALGAAFASAEECFAAAVAAVGDGLLSDLQKRGKPKGDWPRGVRDTLAWLLRELAEQPLHGRTLAELAFLADEQCSAANLARLRALAAALIAGAPPPGPEPAVVDMLAGALLHTLRCQVVLGRVRMLPLLADHLAFVVMTPCVGAQRAAAAVSEPR